MAHRLAFIQRNPNDNKRGWVCETSWGHLCSSGKMRILSNSIKICEVCSKKWGVIMGWWTALQAQQHFRQGCAFVGNKIYAALLGPTSWLGRGRLRKPKSKKAK